MSNQVYANSQRKYFACPGVNSFATAAGTVAVSPAAAAIVPFETPVLVQGADQVSSDAGIITFLQDGVYSVSAKVSFQSTDSPNNSFVDARFYLELRGGFAADLTKLADIQQKWIDRDATPSTGATSVNRIVTLTYTGFFNKNDTLTCKAQNFRTTAGATISILPADSGLLICKLV